MGQTELPGTTQPGGPGFLSITTQQLDDGVQGVSYTTTINTSGGSGRLTTCRLISGTLPTGFAAPVVSGSTCILTTNGQPVTGPAGKFTISIEAGDSSTPQRTDQRVYSLTIRPQFTINSPVILDGVAGRSYSRAFTVTTNLQNHGGVSIIGSSEAGNGPVTQCTIIGLPAAFAGAASCAPDASGVSVIVSMRAAPGTLASGTYPFTLSVTDSPIRSTNQTGVVTPASTTTITPTLVVRQEFAVTQGTIAEAVQGRTYGVATLVQGVSTDVVAAAPPVNSGQPSEIGNGPLTSCSVAVAPADPALAVTVDPKNPNRCLLESTTPAPAAGTYMVTVSATDSPVVDPASPGSIVVPANTEEQQLTWVVATPISYTLNFDTPSGQPGQAPDAVENRTYGSSPKIPLTVTATGGLSATDGLSINFGGSLPLGVTCTGSTPNPQPPGATAQFVCTSGGNAVTAVPGSVSFTVVVSDTGNSATPAGSISSDTNGHASHTLKIDAPLALAANLSDPLPHGVSGRPYGTAPNSPLLYSASGGLGGYSFQTPASVASPAAAFPQGIACVQGSGTAANTFSCSATSITANGSTTASYGPVPVTVDDTANSTTPDGLTSGTSATQNRTLAVEPPLSITPVAGIDPPPQGVQGRTYGSGSGFSPLAYVVAGGDPPYTNFTFPSSIASPGGGVPAPVACQQVSSGSPPQTEVVCSSQGVNVSANPGAYTFQFSVSDSGSGETAPSTVTLPPRTITINAPLAWSGANPTSNSPPPGVKGRTYGGAGFTPLTYNATGGIGVYTFTLPPQSASPGANALPAGVGCVAASGTQVVCSSGATAVSASPGAYPFSVVVNDAANATTPGSQTSSTAATVTKSLAIESPMVFTPTSLTLVTAVIGRAYGQGSGCSGGACQPFDYTLSGGLGGYQSTINPGNGIACVLQINGTTYQCSSAGISGATGTQVLSITSTDTGNTAAPSATASSTTATATATLPINAAMTITPPSGSLAPAVTGRTYGSGAGCSGGACQPLVFSIAGGLGGYSATPTSSVFPGSFSCPFSSTGSLSGTYTCSTTSGVSGSGSASLTITSSDTANSSAPTAQATSSPITLTIFPEITFTSQPVALPDAVAGRTYGFGSTCGSSSNTACQPITYSVNGGLGGYSSPPTLNGYPGGFACQAPVNGAGPTPSASYTCLSSGSVSGAAGPYTVGISVADTANGSTPAISAAKASNTATLRVDPALALALSSGAPVAAVDQRSYGTGTGCTGAGGACAPITYSISNGLGTYATPAILATSFGFVCTLPSPSSSTYQCSASPVNVTPAPTSPAAETLAVTASDVANASTPAGSASNSSASVTVNPPLQLSLSPSTPPPDAVTGRSYGTGPKCGSGGSTACSALQFTASHGTGSYTFPTPTPAGLSSAGFSCTAVTGAVYSCTASSVSATSSIDLSTVSVKDAANASTPTSTLSLSGESIPVDRVLAIKETVLPNALIDYTYSTPLTAQNGLGSYAWVLPSGSPVGACTSAPAGTHPTGLTASALTGSPISLVGPFTAPASAADSDFTFGVCLTDTANQTTPAGSALPNPPTTNSFTVNVFHRYAYIPDIAAGGIQVIDTGESATAPSKVKTITLSNIQGSVAVTPDGNYAFVPLTTNNGFAVIDTITSLEVTGSPFSFPSGATCTGPVGVAFSPDSNSAYFACSSDSEVAELDISKIASSSKVTGITSVSTSSAGPPAAIAVSPDGSNVYVVTSGTSPQLLIYTASSLGATPTSIPLAAGVTPVAIALAGSSPTYAYIAEQISGSPGQVDVYNSGSGKLLAPAVTFAAAKVSGTTYNPEPSRLAVTSDGARIYVGLQGTDEFAEINAGTSTQVTGSPFLLPSAASGSNTTIGASSPNG
ncbi:MAG: YncE family protein, partial [Acidobacteriota bacterium]|nr:YncE family protein [Acidobacteriota bacterium]